MEEYDIALINRNEQSKQKRKERQNCIALQKSSFKRSIEEKLPKGSVAVKVNSQRHEDKRSRGEDDLAQPQNEAGASPHGTRYMVSRHGMLGGCGCCFSNIGWDLKSQW